jgi:hypothetical protein
MRCVRIRRRDNDLRRKDRGGILRRRFGAFTMPGRAMTGGPGRRGDMDGTDNLKHLPLRALHEELGGSFVPFAGWEMPVRYGPGVMAEHLWCREKAGLFDVSHMGQVMLPPDAAEALEALVPMDVIGLAEGRQRYAFFTNDAGGLLDDLMIARHAEGLHLVVNAACATPISRIWNAMCRGSGCCRTGHCWPCRGRWRWRCWRDCAGVTEMRFMDVARLDWEGAELWVSRSGYTGEDGFEISCRSDGGRGLRARCWTTPPSRPSASARATRCGWRPGCRFTDRTSARHHAGRGGPDLGHPEGPPPRAARGRAAIRARMSSRHNGRWRAAQARGSLAAGPGADARRNGGFRDGERRRPSASSPRAGLRPASVRPSRWR